LLRGHSLQSLHWQPDPPPNRQLPLGGRYTSPWSTDTMPFLRRRGNIASEAEADASAADASADLMRLGKSVDISRPRSDTNPSPVKPSGVLSEEPAGDRSNGNHPSHNDTQLDPRPTEKNAQNRHRFSTLRFRNASDPHLSARLRQQASEAPPMP